MNRIIKSCIVIAVCFLLTSCGKVAVNTNLTKTGSTEANKPISTGESIQVNSAGNYGVYDMTGEFINKVYDNPLDRDYQFELRKLSESKDFSTLAMIEIESKYTQLWDAELNAIYNKLLAKLNPQEKEVLIESQKGWLQYHLKETEFVNQVFYLRESGQIFGSQGKVQIQQAIKGRLRERTLELLEYYSLLGNDIEFEYTGIKNISVIYVQPIITYSDNLTEDIIHENAVWARETLEKPWAGFYSQNIPIWAYRFHITDLSNDYVRAEVFYFPLGKITVQWDGLYDIIEPLN